VVVTGLGILSSVGIGKDNFWEGIKHGRSGIKPITRFNAETYPSRIAGEITDFDPQDFFPRDVVRRADRFALQGLAATKLALQDADLPLRFSGCDRDSTCVVVGTSVGALAHAEETHALFLEKGARRISPFFNSNSIPSSLATQIGMMLGLHGFVSTVTTACASGTTAIGDAYRLVRHGGFDMAVAGASEAPVTPLVTATFCSAGILSTTNENPAGACRPFSKDRNGPVLAEGAAMVVLEERSRALSRGAKIYAEVLGYGATFDSYHTIHPLPSGRYSAKAMMNAIAEAGITPEDIDYINAHGSASHFNDAAETMAIKLAFGDYAYRLAISSTKSIIGHTLGACGAMEFVACALMLEHQFLHPTINLNIRDPECDLDYISHTGRARETGIILSNSSGFGGYNAACVLKRAGN
jgi:3-oxoacyl-[acyl-carrier-protein] synthase II